MSVEDNGHVDSSAPNENKSAEIKTGDAVAASAEAGIALTTPAEIDAHSAQASFSNSDPAPKASAAPAPKAAPASAPAKSQAPGPSASAAESDDLDEAPKEDWVEIAKTVGIALAIALVLRTILFQPFTIPSASMEPNLYEGDYLVVSKWDYGLSRFSFPLSGMWPIKGRIFERQANRGDIVVFKLPSDNKTDYIKRVIGVPGDQIQMRDGLLYINDQPVKDVKVGQPLQTLFAGVPHEAVVVKETLPTGKTFLRQDIQPNAVEGDYITKLDNTATYTVQPGYYFMMGDNRRNSSDSRVDPSVGGVGFVPAANLEGKAQMILLSWYPGASLWKPWTWFTKLRPSRFFKPLV